MKTIFRATLAAAIVTAAIASSGVTSDAQGVFAQPIYARINAITPNCRKNPDYPVVGRVAGYISDGTSARLAWVGCFPSFAQCDAWRRIALGEVFPPIQFNTCEERH
ncbi:MAG: hypothetical protein AAGB11_04920 [Pseudomonadota bacterium]